MKRFYIIIVAFILAILTIAVWHECQNTTRRTSLYMPSNNSTDPTRATDTIAVQDAITKKEQEAELREKGAALAKRSNTPIAYFGKVVDQDGKPLQGVAIEYTVTAIPMMPSLWGPDDKKKGECVTDQNGLFSIDGEHGVSLTIKALKKSGYRESGYYEQAGVRYEPYSPERHMPDRDKPVEFMLIRDDLQKAEEALSQQIRFNWNAESTILALGPNVGKLELTASRTGRDKTDTVKKFAWEVKMHTIGFNLVKLPDENARIAPLEGYGTNARVGFSPEEKTWKSEVSERYAILTDSGIYGLMDLSVYGGGNDGGVCGRVTVYLNKGGTRNLDHK